VSKRFFAAVLGAGALAVSTLTAGLPGAEAASTHAAHPSGLHAARACTTTPAAGHATCFAKGLVNKAGYIPQATSPLGTALSPTQLQSAYNLGGTSGAGRTVAIVDAFGYPNLERDLTIYRQHYGMPDCTTSNTCLRIINQTGGTTLPRADLGWSQEQALDVDSVSATCPDCKILLVEAKTASFSNLAAAVNAAAKLGATAISNSYGGTDQAALSAYEHPGIAITASTGDNGYQVQSPASFPHVVAVGGTSLTKSGSTYTESAWNGAGSGCSTKNGNPGWQNGTACNGKANADVSAVADPNTGVNVYDSTAYQGISGWLVFGGTSASSPIIASVYTLAGNFGTYAGQYTWGHPAGLHDVTTGSNGSCTTAVWCHAGTGWDGPTGLGTPNGLSAF
jgi:subtilase family serine protease